MTVRCPLWLALFVWIAAIAGIGGGVLIHVMEREARAQLLVVYDSFAREMADNMEGAVDSIVTAMRDASLAVDTFEPRLATCAAPATNHTGEVLLRALTALPDTAGTDAWLSLGLMQRASTAIGTNETRKWSWQMAAGFGCREHIYAFIDAATAPAFVGYCAELDDNGTFVLSSAVAYNGTDWGFTELEKAMLFDGAFNESFVPVKALLGTLEFSYRRLVRCGGRPYALVFASRTIAQLDAALRTQRATNNGVAFVVERATGLLVAASIANQTHVLGTEARVPALNASDARIRDAAAYLRTEGAGFLRTNTDPALDDPLYVSAVPYAPARGIDWLLVVAVDAHIIAGPLGDTVTTARTVAAVIVVAAALITAIGTIVFVTLPVRRMLGSARGRGTQLWCCSFSEIWAVDEALLRAEK